MEVEILVPHGENEFVKNGLSCVYINCPPGLEFLNWPMLCVAVNIHKENDPKYLLTCYPMREGNNNHKDATYKILALWSNSDVYSLRKVGEDIQVISTEKLM